MIGRRESGLRALEIKVRYMDFVIRTKGSCLKDCEQVCNVICFVL